MSDELVLQLDPPYAGSAVSPTVDITETTTDVTVTITDFRGEHSYSVEKTDQAIEDAEQAATNANNSASQATATANAAAQYARDTADQAAADAQETADAAAGRADTAAASATQAAQAANTAAGTANTSAQNADAKAALADSKAGLANQAATNATTAAQAAEAAKTAANTAAGQATTAAGNATTAAGTANTAATNADAKAQLADTAASNADTATANANTATTAATNAAQAANNAADYAIEAADDMPKLVNTASGTTAQTVNDAWPTTPESATLYGKCVQDGTPTPDNPVPVQVVGGRNIIPYPYAATSGTYNGVTATIGEDGRISLSGTATSDVYLNLIARTAPITLDIGSYTLSASGLVNSLDVTLGRVVGGSAQFFRHVTANAPTATFTLTESNQFMCYVLIPNGTTVNTTVTAQLELGTHATPYTPYGYIGLQTGDTVTPIDMQGQTLAGLPDGTRDVLRVDSVGRVWIEKHVGRYTVTGSEVLKYVADVGTYYRAVIELATSAASPITAATEGTYTPICSKAPYSLGWNSDILHTYVGKSANSKVTSLVMFAAVNSAEEVLAAYTGAEYYYKLATPTTIELGTITLPELTQTCELAIYASLDPEWAIQYEQDPNAVITSLQASIAPVEGSTASTNYAVNSYLIHGNQLYRVTSAIATGEAITPGSNCVACTVMGEVVRLTA